MLDVGTIGGRKCEVALNSILMELNKENISKFVITNLGRFRKGLKQLNHIPDLAWRASFIDNWYKTVHDKIEKRGLPIAVHSHTMSCLKAYYREAIPSRKNS